MKKLIGSWVGLRGICASMAVLSLAGVMATPYLVEGQSLREAKARPVSIDAVTYSRVQTVREELGLTDEGLAELGADGDQAEAVLSALLSWTQRNEGRIEAVESDRRWALRELREARRRLAVGPPDERLRRAVPEKAEALREAEEASEALCRQGAEQAVASLRPDQRQAWETLTTLAPETPGSNFGSPGSFAPRSKAGNLRSTGSSLRLGLSVNGTGEQRLSAGLTNQRSSIPGASGAQRNRLSEVSSASRRVLPPPEELEELIDPSLLAEAELAFEEEGQFAE